MINVLSKETIDKIAAGEVAERPESVVKELCDNAIDAGPTAISVEIKGGGLKLIRVTDNGCGIDREEIPVAFVRHATSKLKTADDIAHVMTMGFRGEALASIAAVSDVEMISKTADALTGTLYRIDNGCETAYKEVGAPDGTTVCVRDFLLKIPVRRQFLKSAQTESSYIITTVENMALAHPEISFSLTVDGKNVLHTAGNGRLKDIIYVIYGAQIAKNLIEIDYESHGVHIQGYAAKPVINRSKRDFELFFVNGRCIKADILRKATEDAYSAYMMQHRFPMVVLNIFVQPEAVDVNVHPRKSEVRFSDNALIYDTLFDAIKEAISRTELVIDAGSAFDDKSVSPSMHGYIANHSKDLSVADSKVINSHLYDSENPDSSEKSYGVYEDRTGSFKAEPFEINRKYDYVSSISDILKENERNSDAAGAEDKSEKNISQDPAQNYSRIESAVEPRRRTDETAFLQKKNLPYFKMIGQVFETYWIIEYNNEMYVIDQHAAHEKVNYERFVKLIKGHEVTSQMLYPPIVLTLSAKEAVLLEKNLEMFSEAGYEIEYAGDRDYVVRAVPSNLPGIGEYELLKDIIENIFDESKQLSSELLKDKIASMSCKAAVKGNNRLSEMEMKALIEELLTLDNPYACPHGRPTIIKWSKYDLDKLFKRIV